MQLRSLSLASLMLAASVLLAAAEDKPAETTAPTVPAAPAAPQWSEFTSDKQGFAVSFPGAPKVTTAPVEGQNPLLQHDFQVSLGEDTVYTVVVFEYPQGKAPKADTDYYVKLINAYAKGSETRLRRRGPATVDGRAGFEGIADDGKNKLSSSRDGRSRWRPHLYAGVRLTARKRHPRRCRAFPRLVPPARR